MGSDGFHALDPCVHCGFCLPACPTFLATGDEADSPRGRIVLMRALERGEMSAKDPALREHLDACLGCRGCEPVCPSGVQYGEGLETARELIAREAGLGARARLALGVFRHRRLWSPLFRLARLFRGTRIPRALAGSGSVGFGMGMLATTSPERVGRDRVGVDRVRVDLRSTSTTTQSRAMLFTGCVMDRLFGHVHAATRRTLAANGYRVVDGVDLRSTPTHCCGALHLHAGDRSGAEALARKNLAAFADDVDFIAVNSAGCGALLKTYGDLLDTEPARRFAARVKDVSELLVAAGPRQGAPLNVTVAYDAPCHLQHAQGVHAEPLQVLGSIPGLALQLLPGFDRCCGSAGIFSLLEPAMSREVLRAKVAAIAAASPRPGYVATGNPGCLMQIGAGLSAAGLDIRAVHPVELLDHSYAKAGFYE
ncbi:MAG TPA: heterodisulfide reductase-related iron-sulfur binding cluster [Gemmatimonadales bacterium]|jgi:glycolate oxidase iron-sulfur subunit|nr:heterodisulfide reductase-related iron-sulfur binding cluster [Gemmatimonadales bacterium]